MDVAVATLALRALNRSRQNQDAPPHDLLVREGDDKEDDENEEECKPEGALLVIDNNGAMFAVYLLMAGIAFYKLANNRNKLLGVQNASGGYSAQAILASLAPAIYVFLDLIGTFKSDRDEFKESVLGMLVNNGNNP